MRDTGKHSGKSIIFVSSNVKTEFYLATTTGVEVIDFLEAVKYLKAKPEEQPVPFSNEEQHYKHVNSALAQYTTEYVEAAIHHPSTAPTLTRARLKPTSSCVPSSR